MKIEICLEKVGGLDKVENGVDENESVNVSKNGIRYLVNEGVDR